MLFAYSSTISTPELKFEVRQGEIRCGVSTFSSPEIKIRPIFNANNDVMPLNANEFDLLRYAYKSTEIRRVKKKCTGTIDIDVDTKDEVIEWHCTKCNEGGRISGWQKTKWNNRK